MVGLKPGIHRQPGLIPDPLVNQRENSAMDRGSVINDCGDKHYNTVGGKGIPEC